MATSFTGADLQRVAQLARLELTEAEQQLFARQLADILDYARQIQDVDTTHVPPTFDPTGAACPLRGDQIQSSLTRDTLLAQAPDADRAAGLFKVPRVLG